MKVYFKRSQPYWILVIPAIYMALTVLHYIGSAYLYILISIYLLSGVGLYLIQRRTYLELTDTSIIYRRIQPVEIRFDELIEVNFYAGEYIMKSKEKIIMIYKPSVSKKYRDNVDDIFNRVKAEYERSIHPGDMVLS